MRLWVTYRALHNTILYPALGVKCLIVAFCLSSPNAQRHTNAVERACMCESKLISNLLREMRMRTEGEGGGDQRRSQSVDVCRISQKEVPISDWSPGPTKICRPEASGKFTACSSHAC